MRNQIIRLIPMTVALAAISGAERYGIAVRYSKKAGQTI
jgi:hypothetical protein